MNTALVIIDVQNDYFPNGKKELSGSMDAVKNIQAVINHCRSKKYKIIYIQHIASKPNAPFFVEGTDGIEIHESIRPQDTDEIIVKHFPNSFRETSLKEYVAENQITDLVFVGMMTHMCVDTTVRAAFDLGYTNTLIADCCATLDLSYNNETVQAKEVQNAFLAALNGTFCTLRTTEEFLLKA
jgi:nicotinamidase-related amidase